MTDGKQIGFWFVGANLENPLIQVSGFFYYMVLYTGSCFDLTGIE